jgi:hypothetical protein
MSTPGSAVATAEEASLLSATLGSAEAAAAGLAVVRMVTGGFVVEGNEVGGCVDVLMLFFGFVVGLAVVAAARFAGDASFFVVSVFFGVTAAPSRHSTEIEMRKINITLTD